MVPPVCIVNQRNAGKLSTANCPSRVSPACASSWWGEDDCCCACQCDRLIVLYYCCLVLLIATGETSSDYGSTIINDCWPIPYLLQAEFVGTNRSLKLKTRCINNNDNWQHYQNHWDPSEIHFFLEYFYGFNFRVPCTRYHKRTICFLEIHNFEEV